MLSVSGLVTLIKPCSCLVTNTQQRDTMSCYHFECQLGLMVSLSSCNCAFLQTKGMVMPKSFYGLEEKLNENQYPALSLTFLILFLAIGSVSCFINTFFLKCKLHLHPREKCRLLFSPPAKILIYIGTPFNFYPVWETFLRRSLKKVMGFLQDFPDFLGRKDWGNGWTALEGQINPR